MIINLNIPHILVISWMTYKRAIGNRRSTHTHCWPPSRIRMFVYFLILFTYRYAEAAPILVDRADVSQDLNSPLQLKRTLFGITWSCISTVIICAWTSVHPNVPPPNQWKARWNRLWLMFWMIIAPELVLAWAVRQFFAAREIRDEYNRSRPGRSSNYSHDVTMWLQWWPRSAKVEAMDVSSWPYGRNGRVHLCWSRGQR